MTIRQRIQYILHGNPAAHCFCTGEYVNKCCFCDADRYYGVRLPLDTNHGPHQFVYELTKDRRGQTCQKRNV